MLQLFPTAPQLLLALTVTTQDLDLLKAFATTTQIVSAFPAAMSIELLESFTTAA
jgi:hypothetical protein